MEDIRQANAQALAYVRKESLDIFNRLHSILEDVRFVERVCEAYPGLPVIPNLRCGAWYVDPAIAAPQEAYFKSTDGHFGNWGFNLRRPNLHLLPLVHSPPNSDSDSATPTVRGFILVDSTRAGKRVPDALSKTVPIWCAVLNRAVARAYPEQTAGREWDTELYCPPGAVSEQERSQIKEKLAKWAEDLVGSSYNLPLISRPLRPLWVTPATSLFPRLPSGEDSPFIPIICVSASKQVHEGVERRFNGFSYVQGSGDDHELWGMGLSPKLFWEYKDELLHVDRDELPDLVTEILARAKIQHTTNEWKVPPTRIVAVRGRVLIGAVTDMPLHPDPHCPGIDHPVSFIIISPTHSPPPSHQAPPDSAIVDEHAPNPEEKHVLRVHLAEGKRGQLDFLQRVLPVCMAYAHTRLALGDALCVCCDSGRDASVGVALAALQVFFNDASQCTSETELDCSEAGVGRDTGTKGGASKDSIRTRLQWIIASRPQANPSRVTLKRVNEFLLSDVSFRRR